MNSASGASEELQAPDIAANTTPTRALSARLRVQVGGVISWQIYCVAIYQRMRPLYSPVLLAFAALAGCNDRARDKTDTMSGGEVATLDSAAGQTTVASDSAGYPVIRALYLNRFAIQSMRKFRYLLSI